MMSRRTVMGAGLAVAPAAATNIDGGLTFPARRHDPFPVAAPYRGVYAHGVEAPPHARTLYISGQVGVAPNGALMDGFTEQCRQALRNIGGVLSAAEMTYADLVKMTFFLTHADDMDALVAVRREMLDGVRPAVTTVFITGLVSPDWLIEIEAIAVSAENRRRPSPPTL